MTSEQLPGGRYPVGDFELTRVGYGAMQLAGPHVFGPPDDRDEALAVLREVVALGITHIDTSDYYGPDVTNELIREALHPYPDDLHIVTKVGAFRDAEGGWPVARGAATPAARAGPPHPRAPRPRRARRGQPAHGRARCPGAGLDPRAVRRAGR